MGLFVAIEGIDHSGKTTLTRSLADRLRRRHLVGLHKEPSSGPVGTLFRRLSATVAQPTPAVAMALLSAADRHAHQPTLIDAIKASDVLIADRYYLSGLAYHAADGVDAQFYQQLAAGLRRPDVYLYLDVDPDLAATRATQPPDGCWEEPAFTARLPGAYRTCLDLVVGTESARVVRLDASRPTADVERAALAAVTDLLAVFPERLIA